MQQSPHYIARMSSECIDVVTGTFTSSLPLELHATIDIV